MKLTILNETEFKQFADSHEQITFHQTKEWANLKKVNNWQAHYIGLKEKSEIKAASLLLSKSIKFINKKMFYAPRGFLINYNDKELLKEFTEKLKDYIKKENGIFVKIDPFVEYQEHDNNGDIVKNGYNNKTSHENLLNLGYKFFGFNLMQDTLQPRWMHVIETKNKSLDEVMNDMESKTRQILRKNEKCGITTREITKEELPIFKDIMKHTSDRREFVDRPLSYYEAMWDALHDSGILKILIAEIDFNVYEEKPKNEKEEHERELKNRIYKKENNLLKMNDKKYMSNNKQDEEAIKRLENQLEKIKELKDFIARFSANASKSKQATSRKKMLDNIELETLTPSSRKYPFIEFKMNEPHGKEILTVGKLTKKIGDKVIFDKISFTVMQKDKINIICDDDTKKTALFNILMGLDNDYTGEVIWGKTMKKSYLPQDNTSYFQDDNKSIMEWIGQFYDIKDETILRGFLGRMLFSKDDVFKKVAVLSGGEKARCMLSKMMLESPNFLVLDEPTNHLDLESITSLNKGLENFEGEIIFTSRDHELNNTVGNRIIKIEDNGKITDRYLSYDEFIEKNN